jgi:hypothetical protein
MTSVVKTAPAILLGIGLAALALPANATMVLGWQQTASGTTGSGSVNAFPLPGSNFYGDTFSAATTTISGSPAPGWGFYDDFLFTISGPATTDSITSTIDLGTLSISNLEVRLYDTNGNPTLPVLGNPTGGAISGWSNPISGGSGSYSVLNTTLGPGTYVLEVRGDVTGLNGGSYSGTLNATPVPLPAALPLLLSALGGLGFMGRRKAA